MKTCWGDKTFYCSQAWYRSQLFLKKIPGNELEFSCQSTWVRIAFLFRFCFAIWVKWSGPAHQCYAPAMVTIKSHLLLELLPLACKSHYASFLKEIAYPKIIIYRTSHDSKPFFPRRTLKKNLRFFMQLSCFHVSQVAYDYQVFWSQREFAGTDIAYILQNEVDRWMWITQLVSLNLSIVFFWLINSVLAFYSSMKQLF